MKKYEKPTVVLSLWTKDVIVSSDNGMVDDIFGGEQNPWIGA